MAAKPATPRREPRTGKRTRLSDHLDVLRAEKRPPTQDELAREWADDIVTEFQNDPRLTVREVVSIIHALDGRIKPPAFERSVSRLLRDEGIDRRRAQSDDSGSTVRTSATPPAPAPVPAAAPTAAPDAATEDLLSQIRR